MKRLENSTTVFRTTFTKTPEAIQSDTPKKSQTNFSLIMSMHFTSIVLRQVVLSDSVNLDHSSLA